MTAVNSISNTNKIKMLSSLCLKAEKNLPTWVGLIRIPKNCSKLLLGYKQKWYDTNHFRGFTAKYLLQLEISIKKQ